MVLCYIPTTVILLAIQKLLFLCQFMCCSLRVLNVIQNATITYTFIYNVNITFIYIIKVSLLIPVAFILPIETASQHHP